MNEFTRKGEEAEYNKQELFYELTGKILPWRTQDRHNAIREALKNVNADDEKYKILRKELSANKGGRKRTQKTRTRRTRRTRKTRARKTRAKRQK